MDVLQVIKQDHDALRDLLTSISSESRVSERRALFDTFEKYLSIHIKLEEQYLYPEVSGLFPGAEMFVDASLANHRSVVRLVSDIGKQLKKPAADHAGIDKKIEKLDELTRAHLRMEEEHMMPKVRVMIPTQDREDLGVVFHEMRQEWFANPEVETSAARAKRKRA